MRSPARISSLAALALALLGSPARAQPAPPAAAPQRVVTPPKLTHFVEADFPPSEAAAGRGATVVLQIAITATGIEINPKKMSSAMMAAAALSRGV